MVPGPTTRHQQISINLSLLLQQYVKNHRLGKILYSPVDVILGHGDGREVVQPDLVYIAANHLDIVKLQGIEGPPDLVVEILSPATAERDRGYKLKMYARYGVPEYWIVDPDTRTIDVYLAGPSEYSAAIRYGASDVITCALFGELSIRLDNVFGD